MTDELATRIRQARHDAGLSREKLAGALDCSLSTIVRYETGRSRQISVQTVVAIAEATGKPLAFFFAEAAA